MFYKKDKNLSESQLLLEDWKEDIFKWWYDPEGTNQARAEALWLVWQLFWEHWQYLQDMWESCQNTGTSGSTLSCERVEELIRLAEKYRDTIPPCLSCPEWDEFFPNWIDPNQVEPEEEPEKEEPEITPEAPVGPPPPFGKPTNPWSSDIARD